MTAWRIGLPVFVLAYLSLVAPLRGEPAAPSQLRLPDLRQLAPARPLVIERGPPGDRRFHLGFASAVDNVGAGPLVVVASRPTAAGPMRADQVVETAASTTIAFRGVGNVRYVGSRDHAHWHFLPFETYELRRIADAPLEPAVRKLGFCLGDGFVARTRQPLAGKPRRPVFRRGCGRDKPTLQRLVQGISVGYGDRYGPRLAGQSFDVTGLPPGSYVVVHRVNPERRLRESRYGNNVASLAIELSWPKGRASRPRVVARERLRR